MSDSTQKNAFTDDSPSASEDDDDDDAVTDTVNEGSKHIVLGDREAEERIQRARDARKEFFESEHNTTVESYSSKKDDFENEDEQSDNEDILMDDPENVTDHNENEKSASKYPKTISSDVEKANKEKVVSAERDGLGKLDVEDKSQDKSERAKLTLDGKENLGLAGEVAQPIAQERLSRKKQETGPLDSKDDRNRHSRTDKKKEEKEEKENERGAVKSGKSRTGSVGRGGGDSEKSGKGRRESGGSSRNSSISASEGNKQ